VARGHIFAAYSPCISQHNFGVTACDQCRQITYLDRPSRPVEDHMEQLKGMDAAGTYRVSSGDLECIENSLNLQSTWYFLRFKI
jgi:hypothetical protein